MRFKKTFVVSCLIICLFTIASVCASEANDTSLTTINSDDNLEINEDNQVMNKKDNLVSTDYLSNNNSVSGDSLNNSQEDNIEISSYGNVKNSSSDKLGVIDDDLIGDALRANVTAFNVSVADNSVFVIDVADDFNGYVLIKVGDELVYNGIVKTVIEANKFRAGNYTATALFYGDSIYQNLTINDINFAVSKVTPTIDVVINDITYPGYAYVVVNLSNNANGTVNVTIDKKIFSGVVFNGRANVELRNLSAGDKKAKIELFFDDGYNNDVNTDSKFIIYPNNSLLEFRYNSTCCVGDVFSLEIRTYNSTGDLSVYINGQYYNKYYYSGELAHFIELNLLKEGSYIITAILDGDRNFTGYSSSLSFNVVKKNLTIDLNDIADTIYVNSPVNIIATLNKYVTGDVIFNINGFNYTVHVENNNIAVCEYVPLNNAYLNVVARFIGNDMYNTNKSNSKTFNVERIATSIDLDFQSSIISGDDVYVSVYMNPLINGTVNLIVGSKSYDVAIVEGYGWFIVSNLADSVLDVKAVFAGDDKYANSTSEVGQLFVNKILTNLTIDIDKNSMSYHDFAVVNIVLNQSINQVVTLKVNGKNNTVGLVNGKGSFTLNGLDKDNYIINAVFAGDDRYVGSISNTLNLEVTGDNISSSIFISLNKNSVIVGDEVIVTINSHPTITGAIRLKIGSKYYNVAINKGVGTFSISDLTNGTYEVQAIFDGDNQHWGNSSDVKELEVKRIPTNLSIIIDDSSIYVGDSVVVGVVLNQSINNVVKVNVNDKDYVVGIVNGKGNLTLSDLAFGTYTVKATFAGEGKYAECNSTDATFDVNKINTMLTANPVTTVYNINKDLVITLKDSNGNVVRNAKVIVNLNGIKTLTTDNNGQIKVPTNGLAPKAYSAQITFDGNAVYDKSSYDVKVTVNKANPKLTANAKKFNPKVKIKKYTIILKDNVGKAIKKATVSLKVSGKTFKAVTDSKGKATFKITNLKKKGNYKSVITYAGNTFYNKATASAKIKL